MSHPDPLYDHDNSYEDDMNDEDRIDDNWYDDIDDYDNGRYDDMDGDHDSGMRDAGFGTDEDYGYFGGEDY